MIPLSSILQTPQAFPLQQILAQKPNYMIKLIDYISVIPDPFIMNQRQCYSFPLKSVQIFNSIGVYKLIIKKQQRTHNMIDATKQPKPLQQDQKSYQYPYLQRLFKNLKLIQNQEILLGYVDNVLFSVTKKTPEIYQFFKDNSEALMMILKNDKILFALKEFLVLFLTESTMLLYVFLKNMILRTLMFRIVQNEDTGPMVYEMLSQFYSQLIKSYLIQTQDEDKEQIMQVLKNIEEQNFIALLSLKISAEHHRRTYFIAKILNQIASSPNNLSSLVSPYIDTYTQYLQAYEQSQDFMLVIMPDQLMMLKLILKICAQQKDSLHDVKQQSIKRLLVYCNVHQKNSILHGMFFAMIQILYEQNNTKILLRSKIIQFMKNNISSKSQLNFKGLVKRICLYYVETQIDKLLQDEQQKQFVSQYARSRKQTLTNSTYFKQKNASQNEVSSKTIEISERIIQLNSEKQLEKILSESEIKEE